MDLNRQTSICTTAEMIIATLKDKNKYLTAEMIEQIERLKGNINVINKELERVKEENRKLIFLVENYETTYLP
jgi:vacuolar-type H+-ATPase subunit D/Vma8